MEVLERGQERFNIYCTPCHSRVGNGLGEIVQRGFKPAANLHDQVRLSQPISHYFYVMTHGYGAMPDYSAQLTPADRWAVAAYIRALQLSQAATAKDVPAGVQIKNLKEIADGEGHPEYAQPWPMPSTAVQAYKPIASQGTPGMAPAYPARSDDFEFSGASGRRRQATDAAQKLGTEQGIGRCTGYDNTTRTRSNFPPISARRLLSTPGRLARS